MAFSYVTMDLIDSSHTIFSVEPNLVFDRNPKRSKNEKFEPQLRKANAIVY